jgi:phosphoglycolate phosphatase-like HAD superfamily hydrolase
MNSLPSWNDGSAKDAIIDFVSRVTDESGKDYVPSARRIAVFDNDGTLWCEYPMQTQVYFGFAQLANMVEKDPALKKKQPYKAFLEHDIATLHSLGKKAVFEFAFATHAGMTAAEFDHLARGWFSTARNPKLDRLFLKCVYRPQIELLDYLQANNFKSFIVSGGGIDLIRAFAETSYGIPPERVVGSSLATKFEVSGPEINIRKLPKLNSFDDREEKVVNIGLHIGCRPIMCFGNSDGDLAMLRYTKTGDGPRLGLLLHHDDAAREFAYDREFKLSPLKEALENADRYGITKVSMAKDWREVFVS